MRPSVSQFVRISNSQGWFGIGIAHGTILARFYYILIKDIIEIYMRRMMDCGDDPRV